MRCWPTPLLAFALACGTDEARFPDQSADLWCAGSKACDVDAYFEQFPTGSEACREQFSAEVAALQYGRDNTACRWEQDLGEACLDRLRDATCEQLDDAFWVEQCVRAWDCVVLVER